MQLFPFWHAGMGKGRETEKKIEVKKEGGERMRGGERGGCWRTRLVNHEEVIIIIIIIIMKIIYIAPNPLKGSRRFTKSVTATLQFT